MAEPTDLTIAWTFGAILLIVAVWLMAGMWSTRTQSLPGDIVAVDYFAAAFAKAELSTWPTRAQNPRHLFVDLSNGKFCGDRNKALSARWGCATPCMLTPRTDIATLLRDNPAEGVRCVRSLLAPHLAAYGAITLLFDGAQMFPSNLLAIRAELAELATPFQQPQARMA